MKASRVSVGSSNPTPGHVSGKNSNSKRYMQASVHSSIILGQESNPNVHQQMSGLRRYGTYIRWNITESKKRMK